MSADPRARAAERLLAERGLAGARVDAEGDVAAIRADDAAAAALLGERGAALADEVRALGFRYVALDLG